MKHKRSEGFALHLLIVGVLLIAIVGLVGGYVLRTNSRPVQSSLPEFRPGIVGVTFKDGVTYDQAIKVITSYGLSTANTEKMLRGTFSPKVWVTARPANETSLIDSLKQNPDVRSTDDGPRDQVNNTHSAVIHFKEGTTADKINALLSSISSSPLDNQPYTDDQAQKFVVLNVPVGKEKYYAAKIAESPIVAQASVLQFELLQDN